MKNATELVVLVDRSGSMDSCISDAQPAIDKFIKDQASDGSLTFLTLIDFDNKPEVKIDVKTLHPDDLPKYQLLPRGGTALYDALGFAITRTGQRLANLKEEDRPDKVIFVTVTDGGENSSREFKAEKIKEMITHQESVYNWKFVYLGANQDAFAVANQIGASAARSSGYDVKNFRGAVQATSDCLTSYKMGLMADVEYTPKQRRKIENA